MSDLINVLKRINKKIESSSDSYVYYDELTGVIKKISNISEINDYGMLRVNHEQVKDIIDTKKRSRRCLDVKIVSLLKQDCKCDSAKKAAKIGIGQSQ